jgi:phosphoenolpyruvate carboxykinase (GTP)
VPLVLEARDWEHGVYLGATISSERTAAAEGTLGELRRDPFAMLPFCGYNMADHWAHWLSVGADLRKSGTVPRVFQVNWFRKGADGRFLWPGFGENSRVLEWILERVDGQVAATESPIGLLPSKNALNIEGLDVTEADMEELFSIDKDLWLAEADSTETFFDTFDGRVPAGITRQLEVLRTNLS